MQYRLDNQEGLIFIDRDIAYFGNRGETNHIGWEESPYELYAAVPSNWSKVVTFETTLLRPYEGHAEDIWFSAKNINEKLIVPWLRSSSNYTHNIYAGTPYDYFKKIIRESGGKVFVPDNDPTLCMVTDTHAYFSYAHEPLGLFWDAIQGHSFPPSTAYIRIRHILTDNYTINSGHSPNHLNLGVTPWLQHENSELCIYGGDTLSEYKFKLTKSSSAFFKEDRT